MIQDIQPLRPGEDRTAGWKRPANHGFALSDVVAPVVLPELGELLPYYALAVLKRPSEAAHLVALLSPILGRNLYLDADGRWQVPYVPSFYRGYPFRLRELPAPEGATEQPVVLCFDHGSGLFRAAPDPKEGELRFFDDDGELRGDTARVVRFLEATYAARRATEVAVLALEEAGVLRPWTLPGTEKATLQGVPWVRDLYRVDEQALARLSKGRVVALWKRNALRVAHAQVFSAGRLRVLDGLLRKAKMPQTGLELPDNVSELFPRQADDSFDWDKF